MRCTGYFQAAAGLRARVKCPHCEWTAAATEFRSVEPAELAAGTAGAAASAKTPPKEAPSSKGDGDGWIRKGKHLQFGCPHCARPMRMLEAEAGGLTDCPHCGLEIISPDPSQGVAARLSEASLRNLNGPTSRVATSDLRPVKRSRKAAPEPEEQLAEDGLSAEEPTVETGVNPFSAAEVEASRTQEVTPVRTLGLAELGKAFQAREDLEGEEALQWESANGRKEDKIFNQKRGRLFALIGGALLLALGVLFIALEFRRAKETTENSQQNFDQIQAEALAVSARHQAAFEVARDAALMANWQDMLPMVRSRSRVEPLMAEFHQLKPLTPVQLVDFDNPQDVNIPGVKYLQMRVRDTEDRHWLVGVEEVEEGRFLFDWELWVDYANYEWRKFLVERPTEPRPLRVTVARCSLLKRHLEDAGVEDRDTARGVRLWFTDSGDSYYQVLTGSSAAEEAVWEGTSWELGRRVVADVSFVPGANQPDRIKIHKIQQARWVLP